ncbi:MAG: phosphoglucosamine mutase [Frankiales bacterium]|nr:phosphoglucosamine mutase [Frankiales bacterium]
MGKLFGTDGVRGLANAELTPELALAIASAAARVLASHHWADSVDGGPPRRPTAVVGRDSRASGEMLEAAVVAGLTSAGADVRLVGVLPTPAIAYLTGFYGADVGVVLSASHNPMPDNGVKLFARGGRKLPDEIESEIEAEVDRGWTSTRPVGAAVGRVVVSEDGLQHYLDHLLAAAPTDLAGLTVVVDCAHGAASTVAARLYEAAGARVIPIACAPDGLNINDGVGSTHLASVAAAVREHGADLGIAHDGDADRCLAVDADGETVDGDQILAICAQAMQTRGALIADTVVATVMSNLGFHHAMRAAGITVLTTGVGDRYVLEALTEHGLSLGGEQSGHIIFTDAATTGDGLLTALRIMSQMAETGQSLATLAGVVRRLPQVLVNVTVVDKNRVASSESVSEAVSAAAVELGDEGRILLRASGTEQLVRVMVEAASQAEADAIAHRVAAVVRSA